MIKNIFVQPSNNISVITEYFDFNTIPYYKKDFWSNDRDEFGGHQIPEELVGLSNNLLIFDRDVFQSFVSWDVGKEQLIEFAKKNYIWIWNDFDGLVSAHHHIIPLINNSHIPSDNITIFVDGNYLIPCPELNIQTFPVNAFLAMPRLKLGLNKKTTCSYDFLLTTIIKPGRQHRDILSMDLSTRSIYACGLISQRTSDLKYTNWIGDTPHQYGWKDGYPSMDLYNQCWFEIAPETMYQHGYFYTEKTNKPIATKTPFLTVSTKGYLEYLRSLGFKTFDSLIDESYDQQDSIEDRIRLMLDQVEDIITNGSENFYNAAESILNYNFNHLAEISGKRGHLMDAFITQQLERIGFKL